MGMEHTVTLTPYIKVKVNQEEITTKNYGKCHGQIGSDTHLYCSLCGSQFSIRYEKTYEDSVNPYDDIMDKIDESLSISSQGDGVHIYTPNSSFSEELPNLEEDVVFSITPDIINHFIMGFKNTYKADLEIIQQVYKNPPEVLFGVISEYC